MQLALALLSYASAHAAADVTSVVNQTDPTDPTVAVRGLLNRLLPHHATQIALVLAPLTAAETNAKLTDRFAVGPPGVTISGSSGVALAAGVRHYLWRDANASFSWWGDNPPAVGKALPPATPATRSTTLKYRMAMNSCAFGYSTPYWNFKRWTREIDLMALRGVNVVNQHEGGSAVYQKVFESLGIRRDEMEFPGVTTGQNAGVWLGPRPQSFIDAHAKLQQQVVKQMRSFGMRALLQVWGGDVPNAYASHFPEAKLLLRPAGIPGGALAGTGVGELSPVLHPEDQNYSEIGTLYVKTAMELYGGQDHLYDGGTWFDEGNTEFLNTSYVAAVSNSTFEFMAAADNDAAWIDSAWRFAATSPFWLGDNGANMKAFLTAMPKGRHVARNIAADLERLPPTPIYFNKSINGQPFKTGTPVWQASGSYFNTSWLYGQLQNYGGRSGLYARLDAVVAGPAAAYKLAPTLEGTGTFSEGIGLNPVAVDLLDAQTFELNSPQGGTGDVSVWLRDQYLPARYPFPVPEAAQAAWALLHKGFYNCQAQFVTTVIVQEPGVGLAGLQQWVPPWQCVGSPTDRSLGEAWLAMLRAANKSSALRASDTFGYDLAMVTAQALNMVVFDVHNSTVKALHAKDLTAVSSLKADFLGIISGLDDLMGTRGNFLLGRWLQKARSWGGADSAPPQSATCELPAAPQVCSTGPLVGAGRKCAPPKTAQACSANCLTCSGPDPTGMSCLTCKAGFKFFDFGKADCTGSCNSNAGNSSIPEDLCGFRGCCFNSSRCFERKLSATASYLMDAKIVITLLGTQGSSSQDYAGRLWQGLLGDYYHHRWETWFELIEDTLRKNVSYVEGPWATELREWQENWVRSDGADQQYATEPTGNAADISQRLWENFSRLLRKKKTALKSDDGAGRLPSKKKLMQEASTNPGLVAFMAEFIASDECILNINNELALRQIGKSAIHNGANEQDLINAQKQLAPKNTYAGILREGSLETLFAGREFCTGREYSFMRTHAMFAKSSYEMKQREKWLRTNHGWEKMSREERQRGIALIKQSAYLTYYAIYGSDDGPKRTVITEHLNNGAKLEPIAHAPLLAMASVLNDNIAAYAAPWFVNDRANLAADIESLAMVGLLLKQLGSTPLTTNRSAHDWSVFRKPADEPVARSAFAGMENS